jgi:hypothetical protein
LENSPLPSDCLCLPPGFHLIPKTEPIMISDVVSSAIVGMIGFRDGKPPDFIDHTIFLPLLFRPRRLVGTVVIGNSCTKSPLIFFKLDIFFSHLVAKAPGTLCSALTPAPLSLLHQGIGTRSLNRSRKCLSNHQHNLEDSPEGD